MAEVLAAGKRGASDSHRYVVWLDSRQSLPYFSDDVQGCALTCSALVGATRSIRAGNHDRTNQMFRNRIYAQGFTLAVIVAGSLYYKEDRKKRKTFDKKVAEKRAEEKRQAWIRELEARDREDQELKAKKEAAKRKAIAKAAAQPAALQAGNAAGADEKRRPGVLEAVKKMNKDT